MKSDKNKTLNRILLQISILKHAYVYGTTRCREYKKKMRQYEFVKKFKNHKIIINNE
jgi:hypothetical protein